MLHVDLLQLEVGYGLIPFVDSAQDGELLNRIQSIRKQFALNNGFIVPPVHIRDNLQLTPNQYRFSLKGVKIDESEIKVIKNIDEYGNQTAQCSINTPMNLSIDPKGAL